MSSGARPLLGGTPLAGLRDVLRDGRISSAELADQALTAARATDGEGARVFTRIYANQARASAQAADYQRRAGGSLPLLLGIPVSVKDAFDVADEVTLAGSIVLRRCSPAERDSVVVSRLKAAGAVIVGRTNMSELGFSAVGDNPHYGTPRNPFDRTQGRIPGGSSSGAAVSVTDGMAAAAVCSDTGGSARVPAALCGLTGFRPTTGRIPRDGMVPVSRTLDAVGILGPSVECCEALDAVLNGAARSEASTAGLRGVVFGVPTTVVLDDMDWHVARAFERALRTLAAAGAVIVERPLPTLGEVDYVGIGGSLVAAEAYWWHKPLIGDHASLYDPSVLSLIRAGEEISGLDYVMLLRQRTRSARRLDRALRHYDYLLMPSVPVIAAPIQSLAGDCIRSGLMSALLLRNPAIVSFLDWCALSIPCHLPGEPPVGLTVAARGGRDASLLGVGKSIEACLAGNRPCQRRCDQ